MLIKNIFLSLLLVSSNISLLGANQFLLNSTQDGKIKIAFQEGIENKINKIFYLIDELYESRLSEEGWYKPLPTNYLYLSKTSWKNSIHDFDKI